MAKRQPKLPGTQSEKLDENLSKALEEYIDATSAFAKQRHEVTQKRAALLALMHDRKIEVVRDDELGLTVSIEEKEKLKITKDEADDEEESDDESTGEKAA